VIEDDVVYLPLHHSLYILQPLVADSNSLVVVEKTNLVAGRLAAGSDVAEVAAATVVGGSDERRHSVLLPDMSFVNQDWHLVTAMHDCSDSA
jgi:hypothetical protein